MATAIAIIVSIIAIVLGGRLSKYRESAEKNMERVRELEREVRRLEKENEQIRSEKAELEVEKMLREAKEEKEDNKAKGNAFEEFIISLMNSKMKFLHRASDYYADGVFPEDNMHPDLLFSVAMGDQIQQFAVECKWRRNFVEEDYIKWSYEEQMLRYKEYSNKENVPVFVAIGIGGVPEKPEQVYIVPLDAFNVPFATVKFLSRYKRNKTDAKLFYNMKKNQLL